MSLLPVDLVERVKAVVPDAVKQCVLYNASWSLCLMSADDLGVCERA